MSICMHVCMYVLTHVCLCVFMYVWDGWMSVRTYVRMYVLMYVYRNTVDVDSACTYVRNLRFVQDRVLAISFVKPTLSTGFVAPCTPHGPIA